MSCADPGFLQWAVAQGARFCVVGALACTSSDVAFNFNAGSGLIVSRDLALRGCACIKGEPAELSFGDQSMERLSAGMTGTVIVAERRMIVSSHSTPIFWSVK